MDLAHDLGKILSLKAFAEVPNQKWLNMDTTQANIQKAHISLGSLSIKLWEFDDKFMKVIAHHQDVAHLF